MGLRLAIEALAARDPVVAMARFESFKDTYQGSTTTEIEGGLVAGMAASDPELLLKVLQESGEHQEVAWVEVVWSTGEVSRLEGSFEAGAKYLVSRHRIDIDS